MISAQCRAQNDEALVKTPTVPKSFRMLMRRVATRLPVALLICLMAACAPRPRFDVVISSEMTQCDVEHCHAWVLLTPAQPTSLAPAQPEVQLVGVTTFTTTRTDPRHLPPVPHTLRFRQTSGMPDGTERQTAECEVALQPMTVATPGTAYVDVTFGGASCMISVRYDAAPAPASFPPPP